MGLLWLTSRSTFYSTRPEGTVAEKAFGYFVNCHESTHHAVNFKAKWFPMVLRQDTVVMIDASAYVYSTRTYIYIYIIHICYMCFFDTGMHIYTVLSNSSNTAPFGQPSNTAFSDILLTQPSQHSFPWTAFLRQSSWQVF